MDGEPAVSEPTTAGAVQDIQGGALDSGDANIGAILGTTLSGSGSICSGVLVAPSYVLTAKHCQDQISDMYFSTGAQYPFAPAATHHVDQKIPHPTADLLLVHLATPATGITPRPLVTTALPAVGTTCTTIGYGTHNTNANNSELGFKRSVTNQVTISSAATIRVAAGAAPVNGVADAGDSGGPLICGGKVVAVVRDHIGDNNVWPNRQYENYTPVDVPWVMSHAFQQATPTITFQRTSDTLLWEYGPDGTVRLGNGLGMLPGTDVSGATLLDGRHEAAWSGSAGQLWTNISNTSFQFTGQSMVVGTSPAIASLPTGGAKVIFQRAGDTLLCELDPSGAVTSLGAGVGLQSGTRISIATFLNNTYQLAWPGSAGQLWTYDSGTNIAQYTNFNMPVGASPAIVSAYTGGYTIVFPNAADSNFLWTLSSNGVSGRLGTGLGIQSGTRPALAPLTTGSWELAWNGGGGALWIYGPNGIAVSTGVTMRADASPSITALPGGGYEVVYATPSGQIGTYINGTASTLALDVLSGTNPAVTPLR